MNVQAAMFRLREMSDKVTNIVMNYTEVEAKVREATNDEQWGPHGSLMAEISKETYTYEHFPEVMGMLWKRMLQDNKKNWRRVYKSLLLLSYLILNGSERVVTSAREHLYDLKSLESYTCTDEFNRDQGNNVRSKVRDLIDFIQDDERLRSERKKSRKAKDKFVGLSGVGSSGYSDRYDIEPKSSKSKSMDFNGEFDDRSWKDRFGSRKKEDDEESEESLPEFIEEQDGEDSFTPPRKGKVEFKDEEEDEETFTSTTRTERKTKRKVRSSKKVDLGAAATYSVDSNGNKPTQSNGSDLISIPTGNQEAFADFSSANNSLDDFNPRAGTEAPPPAVAAPAQADFANFQSSNQMSSQNSGTLESGFGDFQSNSSFSTMVTQQSQTVSVTSLNSNMSLLSQAPPLQPQMMASIPPSGNLMQPQQQIMQPIQPSQFTMRPTPTFSVFMPSSITDMSYVPINPLDGTPDWNRNAQTVQTVPIYPVHTPTMVDLTSQNSFMAMQPPMMGGVPMAPTGGMSMQPMAPMSGLPITPTTQTSTSTVQSKKGGTIWADSKVNIDIDSLSLSDKYKKHQQPSMNQLQQQTPPQMVGVGQINMGAPQMAQRQMGMAMPQQQQGMMGMQGNMRMAPQGYSMQQPPNMTVGMQPGMPMQGNMGMQQQQQPMSMQSPMGMGMQGGMMGQPTQYGAYGAQ
ncbi:uncharacterized protein [Apostichopus japonicus]|uniref:uncharacterized protein isoform X2 n=1 Tax=Stichopus japonicus TaxID=307972 RepID=UPI003AB837DA